MPKNDAAVVMEGHELPARIGAVTPGEFRALCTGPSDWLLVCSSPLSEAARQRIQGEAASRGLAVVDLSPGLSVIEISGSAAREVLAKGCGLDFDSRAFAHPRCARTRLAQIAVVIDVLERGDAFDLYVARSHGAWLNEWLTDSALEFRQGPNVPAEFGVG